MDATILSPIENHIHAMQEYTYLYKTTGQFLGFIHQGNIFSRDGIYLGWLDSRNFAWDKFGQFRGTLTPVSGNNYIIKNIFNVSPLPQTPRESVIAPALPQQQMYILPISLPPQLKDGF